ncbi:MAG: FKBP-type peptidyl-prolyl cis-trans isomerase [Planctomycetes bacterium]|nr:FKBP-type peptidyl-prolyl cis-trans isomerase [Planctomycetota bacterium]
MKAYKSIIGLLVLFALGGCRDRTVKVEERPITILSDKTGRGKTALPGRLVSIDYVISFEDGTELLKYKDWKFVVGSHAVIDGIDEGIVGMRVGGRRVIRCPPHKHWGRDGYADGLIPRNTTLIFDIRLNQVDLVD